MCKGNYDHSLNSHLSPSISSTYGGGPVRTGGLGIRTVGYPLSGFGSIGTEFGLRESNAEMEDLKRKLKMVTMGFFFLLFLQSLNISNFKFTSLHIYLLIDYRAVRKARCVLQRGGQWVRKSLERNRGRAGSCSCSQVNKSSLHTKKLTVVTETEKDARDLKHDEVLLMILPNLCEIPLLIRLSLSSEIQIWNRRLVSSVGRAPVCCAGGRWFEPQTGPTLRVLE